MPAIVPSLRFVAALSLVLVPLFGVAATAADYRPGELLVEFEGHASAVAMAADGAGGSLETIRPGLVRLRLPDGVAVERALADYGALPGVVRVQPNYVYRVQRLPDDPDLVKQWALRNTGAVDLRTSEGLLSATRDSDIAAVAAWERTTGDRSVVVAIIDTGIDERHPDLVDNLWIDPETGAHGRNFLTRSASSGRHPRGGSGDIRDVNGHGTLVAGVIAAHGDNGLGTTGVAWRSRLMVLRACDENGLCDSVDIVRAIDYAIAHGARVINASFGSLGEASPGGARFDRLEYEAIQRARAAGVLFVASACNLAMDNDAAGDVCVPASYDLDNIVAVAASDPDDRLARFSNWGRVSVDLAAPGVAIWGPVPDWRRQGACTVASTASPLNGSCTGLDLPLTAACRLSVSGVPPSAVGHSLTVQWIESARNTGPTVQWNALPAVELVQTNLLGDKAVFVDLADAQASEQVVDLRFSLPFTGGGAHVECAGDHGLGLAEGYASGTSLAAPFVTGVAALLLADDPGQDYRSLRRRILDGVDPLPLAADAERIATAGRLDAAGALGVPPITSAPAASGGGGGGGAAGFWLLALPGGVGGWRRFGRLRRIGYHGRRA